MNRRQALSLLTSLPVINFKTPTPSAMAYGPFPVRIPSLADVVAISAGPSHSLALLEDGSVRAWGANSMGQIGDGTTLDSDRPLTVPGVRNAVAIAAGARASVAILSDGTAMAGGLRTIRSSLDRYPPSSQEHAAFDRWLPAAVTRSRSPRQARA